MFTNIRGESLGTAWKKLIEVVLSNGGYVKDGGVSLRELCHVCVEMSPNFSLNDDIYEKYYNKAMIPWMQNNFFGNEPVDGWGYSYGMRFTDYNGMNQLQLITNKLKKNIESKSATICLAYPPEDQKHIPCIYCLDFKCRGGKLDLTAYFRSQDVGKKFCADMFCLRQIQEKVGKELGVDNGSIFILCSSMHIYEQDSLLTKEIASL